MRRLDHFMEFYLLFVITNVHLSYGWTWKCVNGNCLRSDTPAQPQLTETMEVCHLTCGPYGALWPQPTGATTISDQVVPFDPSRIQFDYSALAGGTQEAVREQVAAVSRLFVNNLHRSCEANCSLTPETSVNIYFATSSSDLTLNWNTDESYSVLVTSKDQEVTVNVRASTVYGLRHGLETVSQLIATSNNQLVIVASAAVTDKPAFPHRGLLLDTARNYLPLDAIQRMLDAMSASKLNVLHWHATDSQSFPLELPRVPQLARYGAYSAEEVYTPADLQMLVKYARVRGIHLLLEIDGPAHAGNGWQWGPDAGLGMLAVCVNKQPWRQSCLQPPCGQLNPANPNLYRVLKDVFRDLLDSLPAGEFFHMGGDEVFIPCWNQSSEVTDWMKSRGMELSTSDFFTVWGEYHQKALQAWDEVVGNSDTTVVLWTSHLTNPTVIGNFLDKDRYVIEAWTNTNDPTADQLLQMGYRVIMATRDTWYLDHGFWGTTQYHKWRQAYDNRLTNARGVMGGEAAMWGELVDGNNLDARVWPRAAAVAERLWSNPVTNNSAAENRMLEFRQRLIKRGVKPEAISPEWCVQNEGGCVGSQNIS